MADKRKKHAIAQQRFDLNVDDLEENGLNEFLVNLAHHGRKTRWIVRVLLAAYEERKREQTVKNDQRGAESHR